MTPARDHVGERLPPAQHHPDLAVTARSDSVTVAVTHGAAVLSETQTRGLICELSAAYSRAFDTGTGS